MFKRLLLAACLALPLAAQSADGKKPASQQEKMATCNKEAAAKKLQGEERSKFMSSCLSAASDKTSQQDKMASCNQEASARQLKSDQRQAFMSQCLSGG